MIEQNVAGIWGPGIEVFLRGIKEKLFITKTVKEIIFEGYHVPLFNNLEEIMKLLPFIKEMFPEGSAIDNFAFFYGTNYTDGVINMLTGAGDSSKMHCWNYSTTRYFPGQRRKVRGGEGAPGLEKPYVEMFSNDLCRTLRFN